MRLRRIWIWFFFVGSALFLLSSNFGHRQSWNPVEQVAVEITSPFQKGIRHIVGIAEGIWLNYFYLTDLRGENRRLKDRIDTLAMQNSRYRELLATHDRLQELLQFKQAIDRPALAAQVIGRDPTGWFKSIIIDKGRRVGVKQDMPVVNASGAVGRIVSVSANYAKVLLIIDQNSAVDCLVQRSRDRGMVKGLSHDICKVDYMVQFDDVVAGDIIVTSGLGGVFPKGLLVGVVIGVDEVYGEMFKDIQIRPAVDFSKLEEVLVILKESESLNRNNDKG
jgi:rod shape-determining protein MreC